MKKITPIKASLLSLLIYPGAGQLALKKYVNGLVFMLLFTIPLGFTLFELFEHTNQLMHQILEKNLPLNTETLTELFSSIVIDHTRTFDGKRFVMLIVWIVSSLDAYRLANSQAH